MKNEKNKTRSYRNLKFLKIGELSKDETIKLNDDAEGFYFIVSIRSFHEKYTREYETAFFLFKKFFI